MRSPLGLWIGLLALSPLQVSFGQPFAERPFATPHSVTAPSAHTGSVLPDDGPRNWIGVRLRPISPALRAQLSLPNSQGLLVTHITPDSPAARAGMQVNDVLSVARTAGESYPLLSSRELRHAVALSEHEPLVLEILRESRPLNLTLTPVPLPANWRSFKECSHCPPLSRSLYGDEDDLLFSVGRTPIVVLQAPPVILAPPAPLPEDVTVTTIQTGQSQPIYRVSRNGIAWVVENQNWNILPVDLRDTVRQAVSPPGAMAASSAPAVGQQLQQQQQELQQLRQEIADLKRLIQQSQIP